GERLDLPLRVGDRHGLEGVRGEAHAAHRRRTRRRQREAEEVPAIEPRDPAQQRVPVLVPAGLDALPLGHRYLPFSATPRTRPSNGSTPRLASAPSRNGRVVRDRARCFASCCRLSAARRSSVMLNISATTAWTSCSVSASGSMPPSRYRLASPPLL